MGPRMDKKTMQATHSKLLIFKSLCNKAAAYAICTAYTICGARPQKLFSQVQQILTKTQRTHVTISQAICFLLFLCELKINEDVHP